MKRVKLGSLDARIIGGTDGSGGGAGPAVVLLHGFGAPGDDLVPLAPELAAGAPPGTRFVFLEAPLSLGGFGAFEARAWWMIDVERWQRAILTGKVDALTRDVPAGLAEARAKVDAALDAAVAALGVPAGQLVLGGFSQGAMLSLDVALRSARPLGGLLLFSGTLIAQDDWVKAMPRRQGLHVFQSHGREDPILPFFVAERLGELLREGGLAHTFVEFRGGHGIPREALSGARAALREMIAA